MSKNLWKSIARKFQDLGRWDEADLLKPGPVDCERKKGKALRIERLKLIRNGHVTGMDQTDFVPNGTEKHDLGQVDYEGIVTITDIGSLTTNAIHVLDEVIQSCATSSSHRITVEEAIKYGIVRLQLRGIKGMPILYVRDSNESCLKFGSKMHSGNSSRIFVVLSVYGKTYEESCQQLVLLEFNNHLLETVEQDKTCPMEARTPEWFVDAYIEKRMYPKSAMGRPMIAANDYPGERKKRPVSFDEVARHFFSCRKATNLKAFKYAHRAQKLNWPAWEEFLKRVAEGDFSRPDRVPVPRAPHAHRRLRVDTHEPSSGARWDSAYSPPSTPGVTDSSDEETIRPPAPDPQLLAAVPAWLRAPPHVSADWVWRCPEPRCRHRVPLLALAKDDAQMVILETRGVDTDILHRGWIKKRPDDMDKLAVILGTLVMEHAREHLRERWIKLKNPEDWHSGYEWMRPEDHRVWNPPSYYGRNYEDWELQEQREADRMKAAAAMEVDEPMVKYEEPPPRIPSPEY